MKTITAKLNREQMEKKLLKSMIFLLHSIN